MRCASTNSTSAASTSEPPAARSTAPPTAAIRGTPSSATCPPCCPSKSKHCRDAMIRVVLPQHLRTLANVADREVKLDIPGEVVTPTAILDALEAKFPMLCGTMRDHVTKQRRALVRFFVCEDDI